VPLLVLACREEPEAPQPPVAPVVTAPSPTSPASRSDQEVLAVVAAPDGGLAVDVELHFYSVSELYRGFFSEPAAVGALGRALGSCLDQPAQVVISYDMETRIGRITLRVPPGASRCVPVIGDEHLDLAAIVPMGEALAAYREAVAASFDLRVSNFEVRLQHTQGAATCVLRAKGDHPTTGRVWGRCIGVAEDERCAPGEDGVVRLALSPEDLAHASRCYGS
jgi:hypothetical protein